MARVTRIVVERPFDLRPLTNEGRIAVQDQPRDDPPVAAPPRGITISQPWRVFGAVALCLAITLLLSTKSFVKVAEDEPDGARRTVLLATAHGLDRVASLAQLNRLNAWIDDALHRQDEAPRFDAVPHVPATTTDQVLPTAPEATAAPLHGPPVPDVNTPATVTAVAIAQRTATAANGTLTPTQAGPVNLRPVTTSNPLRVYVAGDSFVDWLGYDLADYGKREGYVTSLLDSKISSGLVRPDYFDWPARLTQAMANDPPPEAVIWFSGANDYQDMRTDSGAVTRGTPEWAAEYRKRAGAFMDIVGKSGAQMYWVGQPIMRDKSRSNVAAAINTVVQEDAATRPWVHYIDTWSMFTDANGNYAAFLPDGSGELMRVRQDEGIHLTRNATTWVSEKVYNAIRRDWKFPPSP